MKTLDRTQFGDPMLRDKAQPVPLADIISPKIQQLIKDMQHTLISKKLGIGLAAPQVGENLALAVITIRPTPHRKKVEPFDLVIINPDIVERIGRQYPMWEGCISSGSHKAGLFAQVPRYRKVTLKYYDENAKLHTKQFTGLKAQVIQHEGDHLDGVLFVDRVKDPKSFMTYREYKKRIARYLKTDQ